MATVEDTHSSLDLKSSPAIDALQSPPEKPAEDEPTAAEQAAEKAALRKFDMYLLPTAFVFLLLSSLDRSNVSGETASFQSAFLALR